MCYLAPSSFIRPGVASMIRLPFYVYFLRLYSWGYQAYSFIEAHGEVSTVG